MKNCKTCREKSRPKRTNIIWFHLHERPNIVRTVEKAEYWLLGPGERGWGVPVEGVPFQFGMMRKFWRWIAQQYECISCHWTVHSERIQMVNFMLFIFDFKKKRKKNKAFVLVRKCTCIWIEIMSLKKKRIIKFFPNKSDLSWKGIPER